MLTLQKYYIFNIFSTCFIQVLNINGILLGFVQNVFDVFVCDNILSQNVLAAKIIFSKYADIMLLTYF